MKKYWLTFASVLMIIVGLEKGMGGFMLLMNGDKLSPEVHLTATPGELKVAASIMIVICCLLVVPAIALTVRRYVANYALAWTGLFLFLIGGIVNSFLLFGNMMAGGQPTSWGISFLIGLFLVLGKNSVKSRYIQGYEYK